MHQHCLDHNNNKDRGTLKYQHPGVVVVVPSYREGLASYHVCSSPLQQFGLDSRLACLVLPRCGRLQVFPVAEGLLAP